MIKEHMLIIRFSAIGDVAMTVPVVYSLACQYPSLRISVLSKPFARPLFEYMPANVDFMEADIKREYRGIKGLNALYRRLVAKNLTAIADFHDILRSNYLRLRFNLDQFKVAHINKHRSGRRRLTDQNHKVMAQQPTSFQNYADVLARLGYPVKLEFTSLFSPEGGNLAELPTAIGTRKPGEEWIGIAPFAGHKGKIYPEAQMEAVIRLLLKRHPHCRIFLFGGKGHEMDVINEWSKAHSQCVNASAMLNGIHDELILMSHLDAMLSMDSANMHLASLVATPVVSVWGATHPYAGFLGWNQDPANVVQIDMPCRPCSAYGKKPCHRGDYACINNITPTMIVDKLDRVLNNKKGVTSRQ